MIATRPSAPGNAGFLRDMFRILRPFWPMTVFATAVGALSGLATAWLLATINQGIHSSEGITVGLMFQFVALCSLSVAGGAFAGVGNSVIGQKVIAALRKDISSQIMNAPIASIEEHRAHRLLAVLTSDIDTVSAFTFNFSGYAIAAAITLGSFVFLLILSPGVFLLSAAAIALGIGISFYAKRSWIRDYEGVRDAQDELQRQYRAITEGAKELRLNRERRAHVHGRLLTDAADRIADLKTRAMKRFWVAEAIGAAIFFVVIGLLLAMQHPFGINTAVISGAVLVLLYVKGPVDQLVSGLPILGQAQVSLRRIAAVTSGFANQDMLSEGIKTEATLLRDIELRGACYVFPNGTGGSSFELGPINLKLHRGETLFIVGENGSGKTTLIKLLLGLYTPSSGQLLLDGQPLAEDRLDDYRQLFSAVFSDYFLFNDLLSTERDLAKRAEAYLGRLEIDHKVRVENGAFTTTDLSTGQRKRLALVHAYLEQRPIMMFDEWAADQDPTFRRVFYAELLPDLKRQGKTLVVVSHDDRYFDAADRIIRLEGGKIVEDRQVAARLVTESRAP